MQAHAQIMVTGIQLNMYLMTRKDYPITIKCILSILLPIIKLIHISKTANKPVTLPANGSNK